MNIIVNPPGQPGLPVTEPQDASSLDRFIWEKGMKILSYGSKGAVFGLTASAIINGSIGLVFTIISATAAGRSHLIIAGGILLSTALIMGLIAFFQYRRSKQSGSEVQLNTEASSLISQLATHIGWYNPASMGNRSYQYQNQMKPWKNWWGGVKTSSQILSAEVFEMLERAAFQYNRLSGLLVLAKSASGRSSRMEPNIRNASDQTMFGILNQVALVDKRPESASAIRSQVDHQIKQLEELGDRLELLLSEPTNNFDAISSTSAMDSVLEDLRMEQLAREEIRYRPSEPEKLDH